MRYKPGSITDRSELARYLRQELERISDAINSLDGPYAFTASADDTTPTVNGARILYLPANTVATAITQLDDGRADQIVTLVMTSSTNSATIADSGNFLLSAAWAPDVDDTLTLTTDDGTTWREISRSAN